MKKYADIVIAIVVMLSVLFCINAFGQDDRGSIPSQTSNIKEAGCLSNGGDVPLYIHSGNYSPMICTPLFLFTENALYQAKAELTELT